MNDLLTLSDVLGRNISVEWHEGVALVRGVAERLLESSSGVPVVPELHQVQISAAGRIDVIGGTMSSEAVRRLGQLLQATLGHSEPPVQLRLIIAQATAPTPAFASIREYDEALAYFERPGRSAVLQALHARAAAAPASRRLHRRRRHWTRSRRCQRQTGPRTLREAQPQSRRLAH